MAHRLLFPDAGHQRCLVHIRMKVQTLLTCHPRVPGGKDLLGLSAKLTQVKYTDQAQDWWRCFCGWQENYQPQKHLHQSWAWSVYFTWVNLADNPSKSFPPGTLGWQVRSVCTFIRMCTKHL